MNKPRFTPGPWRMAGASVSAKGVGHIAKTIEIYMDRKQRIANAHLIAAAPELYEALLAQVDYDDEAVFRRNMEHAPCHDGITTIDGCGRCSRELQAIRALAKARGETP